MLIGMWWNYTKTAWRSLHRHRGYAAINIASLTAGMVCTVLILLWVRDELSYDRLHRDVDALYQIQENQQYSAGRYHVNVTPYPVGPVFAAEIPVLLQMSRYAWSGGLLCRYEDKAFYEDDVRAVDADFLRMFAFPLAAGDARTALDDPHSLILAPAVARKYFGDADPLGQVIQVNNESAMTVTGVLAEIPANSTLRFSLLVPMEFHRELGRYNDSWGTNEINTFVRLQHGADAGAVAGKMTAMQRERLPDSRVEYVLAPMADRHLHSHFGFGSPPGDIQYVYLFSALAGFVLLIACINFMNLATARSSRRAQEIGLRKVVGALRGHMIRQFLGESVLYAALAVLCALPLVAALLPWFNGLAGKQIAPGAAWDGPVLVFLAGVALVTGLVAGSYPALFLSSLRPVATLKGSLRTGTGSAAFRRVLVVTQFALSIGLIIGTGVVYRQVAFMRGRQLGYDKEQVLSIRMRGQIPEAYEKLKEALTSSPAIAAVSAVQQRLPYIGSNSSGAEWEGKDPELDLPIGNTQVDYDFVAAMGIEMVEGRAFSREFPSDTSSAFLINESLARLMDFESAVGQSFQLWREGRVIGVMKDFHFKPVRDEIEPLALWLSDPRRMPWMVVKLAPHGAVAGVQFLEETWERLVPDYPLEYTFMDRDFDGMYRSEERMGQVLRWAAAMAVIIGCLGLVGLASFMAEQRTREIAVRKVLGAPVAGIMLTLTQDFTRWVLVANVIAWPAAWYVMERWLRTFAYRVDVGWLVPALAGGAALAIAGLTVSYQAGRAALTNPIQALRNE